MAKDILSSYPPSLSSIGLGLEAARHIARMNPALLILACRSVERGQEAVRDILSTTRSKSRIECWQLDLADFSSVQSFAKRLQGKDGNGRLDVMLENAGRSLLPA